MNNKAKKQLESHVAQQKFQKTPEGVKKQACSDLKYRDGAKSQIERIVFKQLKGLIKYPAVTKQLVKQANESVKDSG